jgi:hypothetical protein
MIHSRENPEPLLHDVLFAGKPGLCARQTGARLGNAPVLFLRVLRLDESRIIYWLTHRRVTDHWVIGV